MSKKQSIKVLVEGGAATAGPPLGPALGPMGVNAGKVVEEINKITASFKGMKVPVNVIVDPETKGFELEVGSPPTSALLLKALGLETAGGANDMVGDLSFMQVLEVAKGKQSNLLANDLKAAVKEVVGTAGTLKITIEGQTYKELLTAIDEGKYDAHIAGNPPAKPEPSGDDGDDEPEPAKEEPKKEEPVKKEPAKEESKDEEAAGGSKEDAPKKE